MTEDSSLIVHRPDCGNLWWPAVDPRPVDCYDYVGKRLPDALVCLRYAKRRELVVQAGGHVGLWPLSLAKHFRTVVSFEPEKALYAALAKNVEKTPNIEIHNAALGRAAGKARMINTNKPGNGAIDPAGEQEVDLVILDSFALSPDVLVLDVERYELEALAGARETIKRTRPVIHLEVHKDKYDEIHRFMKKELKYRHAFHIHQDDIFVS